MNKIFRPVAKLFGIPIRFNMDSNRLNTDLQQRFPFTSLGGSPGALGGSPLGGRQMPSEAPLVDTRSYETPQEQRLSGDSNSKTILDKSTGEVVSISLSRTGDYQLFKSDFQSREDSRLSKYKIQREASRLLWDSKKGKEQHRTCKCNRVRIDSEVKVFSSDKSSHYAGLMQCGSVWTCPVCAPKINQKKGDELRIAFAKAINLNLDVNLFTFTIPHYEHQRLSTNINKINKARQDFWRSSTAKHFRKSGYIGRVDSFELTHGDNGWHPHVHAIVFASPGLIELFADSLRDEWMKQLYKHGLAVPGQRGLHRSLDIRDGSRAGDYILKFGSDGESKLTKNGDVITWDIADEVTRSHTKNGRGQSLTPFDFLRLSSSSSVSAELKKRYRILFREYSRVMKGKCQVRWSRGLRDYFQLGEQLSDEQLVQEQDEQATCKAIITSFEWRELLSVEKKTGENVTGLLLQLSERNTIDTDQEDHIAKFIYDRTSQQKPFKEFAREFYSRSLVSTVRDRIDRKPILYAGGT